MKTMALVARKGGTGKTTLAVHLAIGAHLRGRKTLLVDADPQRSCMEVMRSRAAGPECVASTGAKLFALKSRALRAGLDLLVIDTPAVSEQEAAHAVAVADLVVMVVRPTFLDLAAAARTSAIIRQLAKPGLIVVNQAPAARDGEEPGHLRRVRDALALLQVPVAPAAISSRRAYQTAMARGASAEEEWPGQPAGEEMARLCRFIDQVQFGGGDACAAAVRDQVRPAAGFTFASQEPIATAPFRAALA